VELAELAEPEELAELAELATLAESPELARAVPVQSANATRHTITLDKISLVDRIRLRPLTVSPFLICNQRKYAYKQKPQDQL